MNNDKLQAEFTNWLDTLAHRTKLNYIRKERKHLLTDTLNESLVDSLLLEEEKLPFADEPICGFEFSVDWLEKAFLDLSEVCQKILYLFIIEEKTLIEISEIIGYSYRHTKRLYALSLETLRIYKEKQNEEQS